MFNNVITKNNTRLPNRVIKSADERALYQKYYGVRWNQSAGADTYERTGLTKDQPVKQTISDAYLPIHSDITAGLMTDDLNFTEFDPTDWTKDTDGNAVAKDGSEGQVVVRYPKIYVKRDYSSSVFGWKISRYNLPGFSVHPWFIKRGQEVDYRYLGAYEGCLYDDSASAYIGGQGAAGIDTSVDKLSSVSGVYPHANEKIGEYRQAAINRSVEHSQQYYWARDYLNLMFLVEYADFNIQNYYEGITTVNSGEWNTYSGYYAITQAGVTDSLASGTGEIETEISDWPGGAITVKPFRWRGLENPFGHLWEFVDGFTVYNVEADAASYAYLCQNQDNFTDDNISNYTNYGELAKDDEYASNILENGLFLPTEVNGSSSTYLADNFFTEYDDLSEGFGTYYRIALVGGYAFRGGLTGLFFWNVKHESGDDNSFIAPRLCI